MAEQQAILVGKWTVGFHHSTAGTILKFDFSDRDPIVLIVPKEQATELARGILSQYENPPPKRSRLS
jgi:hypothetical protein